MPINQDPNFWLALGSGLSSGGTAGAQFSNMSQNLQAYNQQKSIADKTEAEKQAGIAQQNKTLEYLKQQNPQLAEAVAAGALGAGEAYKMHVEAQKPKNWKDNYMEVGGKLVAPGADGKIAPAYDPGPKPEDAAKQQADNFKSEMDVNKMYRGEDEVQSYQGIKAGYEKIRSAAVQPDGASDIAMVFGYMKMLDPTSVVREGEAASLRNAAGVPDQVMSLYNRVLNGEQLPPELRNQIVTQAQSIYGETASNLTDRNKYYSDLATRGGVNSGFIQQPEQFPPLQVGQKASVNVGGRTHSVEKLSD